MISNIGKLQKLVKFLTNIERHVENVVNVTAREVSRKLKGLQAGDYEILSQVRTLSRNWIAQKGHAQVLKDKGDYLKSIQVRKIKRTSNWSFRIYTREKMLAKFLEFGTRNMKPIPHWRSIRAFAIFVFRKNMLKLIRRLLRAV